MPKKLKKGKQDIDDWLEKEFSKAVGGKKVEKEVFQQKEVAHQNEIALQKEIPIATKPKLKLSSKKPQKTDLEPNPLQAPPQISKHEIEALLQKPPSTKNPYKVKDLQKKIRSNSKQIGQKESQNVSFVQQQDENAPVMEMKPKFVKENIQDPQNVENNSKKIIKKKHIKQPVQQEESLPIQKVSTELPVKQMTAKVIPKKEENSDYAEDFEDYEEDFEKDESDHDVKKTSKKTNKTSLEEIRKAMAQENQMAIQKEANYDSEEEVHHQKQKQQQQSMLKVQKTTQPVIQLDKHILQLLMKRVQQLLEFIQLDLETTKIFEQKPITLFEFFLKSLYKGKLKSQGMYTLEDRIEADVQTTEIEVQQQECQWPEDKDKNFIKIGNSLKNQDYELKNFLKKVSPLMESVLDENFDKINEEKSEVYSSQASSNIYIMPVADVFTQGSELVCTAAQFHSPQLLAAAWSSKQNGV